MTMNAKTSVFQDPCRVLLLEIFLISDGAVDICLALHHF